MTNHDEELLTELLLQWEELYERGQDSSPEELCRDCPHLIDELGARITAMKATNWLNNPDCDADALLPASHQATGTVLSGRYRLDTLIATGGFAEVWRAFDAELQRIVAIKLPKPSRLASSTNFITEARRVARLKHPGIVPVFDAGTADGRCFIVSEYVEGGSLADRLAKSPPTVSQTVQWLGEIATALEYAHLHGVIHRDIKPANILIDHHGRALLADFGIAQSAQKTGTFAPSLGTLRYMSPEQLEGRAATPHSDVYSLGVVLHECLTGELPYSSSDPSVLRKEVVEGSTTFKTTVQDGLIEVCKKALRRLPHERHSSAAHFASDLERAAGADQNDVRDEPRLPRNDLRSRLVRMFSFVANTAVPNLLWASLLLACFVLARLLNGLLVGYKKMFDDYGSELPGIVQVFFNIVSYGAYAVAGLSACFVLVVCLTGKAERGRVKWYGIAMVAVSSGLLALLAAIAMLIPLVKLVQDLS